MNKITLTADGSNTLFNETIGEHYHSIHGALQESKHVFIEAGLKHVLKDKNDISIFEVGFGTGLNFLLTLEYCKGQRIKLQYHAIEAFPLTREELRSTGYDSYVSAEVFNSLEVNYNDVLLRETPLFEDMSLFIPVETLAQYETNMTYDLVYYDAFSVQHQPEMWSDEIIAHVCSFLKEGGVFVTYAITGKLKRALKSIGFKIEKLQGAPGKREMLRATKALAE
jgi:tRNA U34 5-methylaminomethyl-2-thiouridine-forming methyltransferase MnmC